MIKAIFWDNDGVLVDTEQLYYEATRDILATVDMSLSPAQYRELFLLQGRGAWHLAEERGLPMGEIERLRTRRNDLYSDGLRLKSRALPGVEGVLRALHGRYVMGCVTSSRKDHFDLIHAHTSFLQYFDFVLTASDVSRVKPDPELYVKAVERAGFPAAQCVAIEDSERGLEAALGAGIHCLVLPSHLTSGGAFAGADGLLDRVDDLPEALRKIGAAGL